MFRELVLNSDEDESDDDLKFILDILQILPPLPVQRPNLFVHFSDHEFRLRYRFDKSTVLAIAEVLDAQPEPNESKIRSLSTIHKILMTLRFLATGSFKMSDSDLLKCHPSIVARVIQMTLRKIATLGNKGYITMPTSADDIQAVKQKFHAVAQFSDTIGALDCCQVRILAPDPGENDAFLRNESGNYSIKVQFVGDSELRIRDITARWGGAASDQIIFDKSYLKARFEKGEFGANSVLLGGSGYAPARYMRNTLRNPETAAEQRYQLNQMATRNCVRRMLRAWKRRFPPLSLGFQVKMSTVLTSIVACAVLHNMALDVYDLADDFEVVQSAEKDVKDIELV